MRTMMYLIAGLFILSILVEVTLSSIKKKTMNQLVDLIMKKDYLTFDTLIKQRKTKFFVPVFNSLMLQLHKAIDLEDKISIQKTIEALHHTKMSKQQTIFFYSKAFSYYIAQKDHQQVETYYQLISKCVDSPTKTYVNMVYDTIVQRGYRYIEEAKALLNNANEEDKRNLFMLIAKMYDNQKDTVQANKELDRRML